MEVNVHSTLLEAQGQLTVITDKEHTVDSLISAFCVDSGIAHKRSHVLRNSRGEIIDNTKSLLAVGINHGDILFLGLRGAGEDWPLGCNQWWLLAGVAMLIGGVGLVAVSIVKAHGATEPTEYGVVIDAGSTHSQFFIYAWEGDKENNTAIAYDTNFTCRVNESLSSYELNPSMAGTSLISCLEEAETFVPASMHTTTDVFLGATAGMRLLRKSNATAAYKILASVREVISKYPFNFSNPTGQARIIEGHQEGSYAWVTANYAKQVFINPENPTNTKSDQQTYGALDLGGASTQMTFEPREPAEIIPEYKSSLLMYGHDYNIYVHSYECYGVNEAFRQLLANLVQANNYSPEIDNPCYPKGNTLKATYNEIFEIPCTKNKSSSQDPIFKNSTFIFNGTSDSDQCRAETKKKKVPTATLR